MPEVQKVDNNLYGNNNNNKNQSLMPGLITRHTAPSGYLLEMIKRS